MKSPEENFDQDGLFGFDDIPPVVPDEAPEPPAPAKKQDGPPDYGAQVPRALSVLLNALETGRLPHSILLYGDTLADLENAAHFLAAHILGTLEAMKHADFFALRPSGKARQIKIGEKEARENNTMRDFIRQINLSASQGTRKVGVVYEADRMNSSTANAFLKTLEEPPRDTTLLLLSTRPYDFLPTIRSRCFHFHIPALDHGQCDESFIQWKHDFETWLQTLDDCADGKKASPADLVLPAYALGGRLLLLSESFAQMQWAAAKAELPEQIDDEEKEAIETGLRKGIRARLLQQTEQTLRDFAFADKEKIQTRSRKLSASIAAMEKIRGLLEVNFPETAAMEHFMLQTLRAWSK